MLSSAMDTTPASAFAGHAIDCLVESSAARAARPVYARRAGLLPKHFLKRSNVFLKSDTLVLLSNTFRNAASALAETVSPDVMSTHPPKLDVDAAAVVAFFAALRTSCSP